MAGDDRCFTLSSLFHKCQQLSTHRQGSDGAFHSDPQTAPVALGGSRQSPIPTSCCSDCVWEKAMALRAGY